MTWLGDYNHMFLCTKAFTFWDIGTVGNDCWEAVPHKAAIRTCEKTGESDPFQLLKERFKAL